MELLVKKLSQRAKLPTRGSILAAGYDLYSARDVIIPARWRAKVPTDIAIKLPPGCYGRIAPRSGNALRCGIDVGGGVIDPDYTGNIAVILFNHSQSNVRIIEGSKIAQLICERYKTPEVKEVYMLAETERGDSGFGSSDSSDVILSHI